MLHPETLYAVARTFGDVGPQGVLRKRDVIGTAFFVTVPAERDPRVGVPHVLTAHHLLDGQHKVEVQPVGGLDGRLGERVLVADWKQPVAGLDLAVAVWPPLGVPPQPILMGETVGRIYPRPDFSVLALGGTILYIGVLTPLDRVMVRSGTIGAVDQTGIKHDLGYDYPCHLVDCRSYGGFSGSPCFYTVALPVLTALPRQPSGLPADQVAGNVVHLSILAGMFTQHLSDKAPLQASRYGVGVMLRSQEIKQALMTDELKAERQKRLDIFMSGPTAGVLQSARRSSDSTLEPMADLMGKLLRVPKEEADEVHRGEEVSP